MSTSVPLRIPVELRMASGRCFRLAHRVSSDGFELAVPVPDTFEGPLDFRCHLPEDAQPLVGRCKVIEIAADDHDERPSRRALRFLDLEPEAKARVAGYVEERVLIP